MTVTSTSQASHAYATSSIHKTNPTSQNINTQTTKNVDKMDEMKEKYKDIYTPIPETYSKADVDLQTQKIYEAYPNYIEFGEFLKVLGTLEDGTPIKLGHKFTSQDEEYIQSRIDKFFEDAGITGEEFSDMQKGAEEIRDKYPVNYWMNDSEKELSRFENAAIYEGLEDGKTLEEAKINARHIILPLMDVDGKIADASIKNHHDMLVKAGLADANSGEIYRYENHINFNDINNSIMDLRNYGIKGNWENHEIYGSQTAMISEIEKKINQFNFMLNNEDTIKDAYSKLKGSAQDLGNNSGYKQMIEEDYMPIMEQGLKIFKNYKIYDSINLKG